MNMKTILVTCFTFFLFSFTSGQPPQLFKYQGLARSSNGNTVSNQTIALRISIHRDNTTGPVVYKETQTTTTNQFGSFNINIGAGTAVSGNFSTISWGRRNYFQEVEMDITGGTGYVSMGVSQLLSVPYALSADSAVHGIAPFIVQNTVGGNTVYDVAMAAIDTTGPNSAPALYVKNYGKGTSIYAESGNGKYVLADSSGFETNGKGQIGDSLRVNGPVIANGTSSFNNINMGGTLMVPIITGTQAAFSNAISATGATVNGNVQVNGNLGVTGNVGSLNATLISGTQGNFSGGITTTGETVNGNLQVNGNLGVTGNVGALTGSLINGTQGNFSVSVTTPSLTVNGSSHITGNLQVDGNLSKASGSFRIDDPLDPLNKILYHSFVESPDMKNIYDGTVMTDAGGNAEVILPEYFEALNKDFRYQLTPIGQFAQAIISKEISNNAFIIRTDKPNVKISWQVTGIRKDAYAEKHRIIPEVEKTGEEKGKYLYPDAN